MGAFADSITNAFSNFQAHGLGGVLLDCEAPGACYDRGAAFFLLILPLNLGGQDMSFLTQKLL